MHVLVHALPTLLLLAEVSENLKVSFEMGLIAPHQQQSAHRFETPHRIIKARNKSFYTEEKDRRLANTN